MGEKAKLLINNPISSFDLINLGNLICGLTQTDILAINNETFKYLFSFHLIFIKKLRIYKFNIFS